VVVRLPEPSLVEIVRRARILVVDDQDFPYSVLFKSEGYNVTKWKDVTKLTEIEQGNYDIILLDLKGIGKKVSIDEGLGVLRHIKNQRPSQIVVAYSNSDWPLQYQPFFDLADKVLPKSADYVDFKRIVDDLLQEHFSVGFHLARLDDHMEQAGLNTWRGKRAVRKAVSSRDTASLSHFLSAKGVDTEAAQVILGLAQVAIGVVQIWT